MRTTALNIKGEEFVEMIFGGKPFEITLARCQKGKSEDFVWHAHLPLYSLKYTRLIASVARYCVKWGNYKQPSAVNMVAVNDHEIRFSFVNAWLKPREKRRMIKIFRRAFEEWKQVREMISWAWTDTSLKKQLSGQAEKLSKSGPCGVKRLELSLVSVQMSRKMMESRKDPMMGVMANGYVFHGVVMLYDKNSTLFNSSFCHAVLEKTMPVLIQLIKLEMICAMNDQQEHLLKQPKEMLAALQAFFENSEKMERSQLMVRINPRMAMLMRVLEMFVDADSMLATPRSKITDVSIN